MWYILVLQRYIFKGVTQHSFQIYYINIFQIYLLSNLMYCRLSMQIYWWVIIIWCLWKKNKVFAILSRIIIFVEQFYPYQTTFDINYIWISQTKSWLQIGQRTHSDEVWCGLWSGLHKATYFSHSITEPPRSGYCLSLLHTARTTSNLMDIWRFASGSGVGAARRLYAVPA